MTSVSIVVPAWNEATVLEGTLEALLHISYAKDKCELIVVAGGDDETHETAARLSARVSDFSRYVVILQAPDGKNAAIQQGIKAARNEMIVLLDADTVVSRQWLKEMIGPIERDDCDLTVANSEPLTCNWVSDYYMITKAFLLETLTMFPGGSIAFPASKVRSLLEHFFDREVRAGVDYLLMKRFSEMGFRVMFAKEARVTTHFPSSLQYFVVSELRWLTAFYDIEGIRARALASNVAVIVALIFTFPVHKTLFLLSLVFHALYVGKKTRVFWMGSRRFDTRLIRVFGFILLSYIYQLLGFIAQMKVLMGVSRQNRLRQGQR
ncbi:MAG: glycosyltransferase [Thermodesulfobacteriota bacterium]|nr:glycosyltransferase [Thermodesulfobacteriota bacterium]